MPNIHEWPVKLKIWCLNFVYHEINGFVNEIKYEQIRYNYRQHDFLFN